MEKLIQEINGGLWGTVENVVCYFGPHKGPDMLSCRDNLVGHVQRNKRWEIQWTFNAWEIIITFSKGQVCIEDSGKAIRRRPLQPSQIYAKEGESLKQNGYHHLWLSRGTFEYV